MNRQRKDLIKKISKVVLICVAGGSIGTGAYFLHRNLSENRKRFEEAPGKRWKRIDGKIKNYYDYEEDENSWFFPTLEAKYFEKFVKVDEYGFKYIDEDIVKSVIHDVIRRFPTKYGSILFDYKIINKNQIFIYMKHINEDKVKTKTYLIELK